MTTVQPASTDAESRATISACIITLDESGTLPGCLASVDFCDEVVVVDSGSVDGTSEIARAAGARVVDQPWLGFAAQRNIALDNASGEWVLEIDADERVSVELRAEILRFLAEVPAALDIGALPRREMLVGHRLGPSAKYPKYGHRLLRRGVYRHDEARTVHEGIIPEGVVRPFDGELVHLLATSWREAVQDTWRYARLEAGQMHGSSSFGACVRGAALRPAAKLLYRLTIDGGWRDGWPGFVKISLDCATDSIVWTRQLLGRHGSERGHSGVVAGAHYGSRSFHRGNMRLVGIAADPTASALAGRWLHTAQAAGADVVLLSAAPADEQWSVRVHSIPSVGPLALIRALDAEEQLRPIDALVTFGWRAGLLVRCVPPGLRGGQPKITQEIDPAAMNWKDRVASACPQ